MPRTFFARKPVSLQQLKSDDIQLRTAFHSQGEQYYIAEEKKLSNQEWDKFTNDLLADTDWAYAFASRNYPETEDGVPCIRVTTPGSEIALIIDTQGYSYARYIGIESVDYDIDSSEIETEDVDECCQEDEGLTEEEVVDGLRALLMGESLDCTMLDSSTRTVTYEEGGYFTRDQGFAIHMANGQVFTITVKEGH